ncbi:MULTISPECIES: hypothetical protein [Olivibacter]|uniref:Uncharacterized protein n=1 Tax=Olivibacter jilunii TaxID=985016 RepID=A0ABW6B046_9SPHI
MKKKGKYGYHVGQRLELRPFMIGREDIRTFHHYETYVELFVEQVTYRGYNDRTDNAIIEDLSGNVRLCNIEHLKLSID